MPILVEVGLGKAAGPYSDGTSAAKWVTPGSRRSGVLVCDFCSPGLPGSAAQQPFLQHVPCPPHLHFRGAECSTGDVEGPLEAHAIGARNPAATTDIVRAAISRLRVARRSSFITLIIRHIQREVLRGRIWTRLGQIVAALESPVKLDQSPSTGLYKRVVRAVTIVGASLEMTPAEPGKADSKQWPSISARSGSPPANPPDPHRENPCGDVMRTAIRVACAGYALALVLPFYGCRSAVVPSVAPVG